MSEEENIKYFQMTICLSSKCNRGCRHCDAEATMDGCFFTIEQAHLLAQNSARYAKQAMEKDGIDCRFEFIVTGDGESLLNPDLPEIINILFSECPTSRVSIITSGADPKNPEEEKRLLKILQQPFANQLSFILSFNIFQNGFPKRLLRTMKFLYENGVGHIDIKITLTHKYVYRTIYRLNRLIEGYFMPLIRKVNPLADKENSFSPTISERNFKSEIGELIHHKTTFASGDEQQVLTESITKIRPLSEWELGEWFVFFQTNFSQTYRFETALGPKTFSYGPQCLVRRGRAKELVKHLLPFQHHRYLCRFLTENDYTKIHIGADGYYYLICDCPKSAALRVGHVRDDIHEVIKSFFHLKRLLPGYMIWDDSWYDDVCDHCVRVMGRMRQFGILKSIGIDCPQEESPPKIVVTR